MDEVLPAFLQALQPRQVVCIGLTTFQGLITWGGVRADDSVMKSRPSTTGKTQPVYDKRATVNGIPVHDALHLSDGR